jgi:hypothetical protein
VAGLEKREPIGSGIVDLIMLFDSWNGVSRTRNNQPDPALRNSHNGLEADLKLEE